MHPAWLIVGGVAILWLLRGFGIDLSVGGANSAGSGEPEYFGEAGAPRAPARQSFQLAQATSVNAVAAAPGVAPAVVNPSVAGPQIAPSGSVSIPSHVDVSYASAPSQSSSAPVLTYPSTPMGGNDFVQIAPSPFLVTPGTTPLPREIYDPAPPGPIIVVPGPGPGPVYDPVPIDVPTDVSSFFAAGHEPREREV